MHSSAFSVLKELDVGARASVTYDSNLFGVSKDVFSSARTSNKEVESNDDFILNFSPSVHFSKELYLLNISGSAGVSMTRYIKNSDKSHIVPITTLSLDFDESLKKRLSANTKMRLMQLLIWVSMLIQALLIKFSYLLIYNKYKC